MSNISQSPMYNLKAVLKETGLKADVLRAWERRYDLPKPQRSSGGHRLYSEYDIEIVKWLQARQAEGLGISRAVDLWNEITHAGRDPLLVYAPAGSLKVVDIAPAADSRLELFLRDWLEAGIAFDSDRAEDVLNQAFAIYPVETVCTEILQKGLSTIGSYWFLGKASVQQEHFISALAVRRIETLIAATPHPTREKAVLVGCPPGEWHTFSALLLHLMLRRRGLKVVYLGADIPIMQMEETAAAIHLDLIVLSAQQITTAASLRSTALALQELGIPLAYGGLIFNRAPGLRQRIPGHFLGESLPESINMVEQLVANPIPVPAAAGLDEKYLALARRFREKRVQIEERLMEMLREGNLSIEHIDEANTYFGNRLSAALELGDITFLEVDMDWVKRLLASRQIAASQMYPYLTAYSQAAAETMGDGSAPITGWIASYLANNTGG